MKTFVIDIDNHIFFSDYNDKDGYKLKRINQKEIDLINKAFDKGNIIILYTGRSWGHYDITINQLNENGVKFHQLVMGKPVGIYIDAESKTTMEGLI